MSRNKKRVQIKKKRAMRRVRRNDNSSRVQTPEQKAKENEMLKLLLGRQMTTPQQNQQHDKQQEKIEQLNKLIYEEQRKASNYEQELKEKNKILDDIRTSIKELKERALVSADEIGNEIEYADQLVEAINKVQNKLCVFARNKIRYRVF